MTKSLTFVSLMVLLAAGLTIGFLNRMEPPPEPPADLSEPLPKEEVIDLFRRLFALSAEDHADFAAAAEAGRVSPELHAFHELLSASNEQAAPDSEEPALPFVDLPDGSRVYPMPWETLHPRIRGNLTQEDLNSLLPEIADLQKRVSEYEEERAKSTTGNELAFRSVRLQADDLAIALAKYEPEEGTIEVPTSAAPDAQSLHFLMPAFLDGRHVTGARIATQPFPSLYLQLSEEGGEILSEATDRHAGSVFGILLRGEFHAAVAIGGRMETRQLQLPGRITEEEAAALIESWTETEPEEPAAF